MTLTLPQATPQYDQPTAQRWKQALEVEDGRNRKKGADLALTSDRLTMTSPNGTNYQVMVTDTGQVVAAGAVVSGNAVASMSAGCGFFAWLGFGIQNSILLPAALSLAKAWVSVTGTTGAILASYNIASVVRNSAGNYTVTFTAHFSSAFYAAVLSSNYGSAISTKTSSTIIVATFDTTTGTHIDENWDMICFGAQ